MIIKRKFVTFEQLQKWLSECCELSEELMNKFNINTKEKSIDYLINELKRIKRHYCNLLMQYHSDLRYIKEQPNYLETYTERGNIFGNIDIRVQKTCIGLVDKSTSKLYRKKDYPQLIKQFKLKIKDCDRMVSKCDLLLKTKNETEISKFIENYEDSYVK